mmetsp:Transcript_9424/g.24228  ORF Transcript_9424/g.24228 Transcript_9424/m.24228 type:complete len:214 (-) Transcript_9424:3353-3994(-)
MAFRVVIATKSKHNAPWFVPSIRKTETPSPSPRNARPDACTCSVSSRDSVKDPSMTGSRLSPRLVMFLWRTRSIVSLLSFTAWSGHLSRGQVSPPGRTEGRHVLSSLLISRKCNMPFGNLRMQYRGQVVGPTRSETDTSNRSDRLVRWRSCSRSRKQISSPPTVQKPLTAKTLSCMHMRQSSYSNPSWAVRSLSSRKVLVRRNGRRWTRARSG